MDKSSSLKHPQNNLLKKGVSRRVAIPIPYSTTDASLFYFTWGSQAIMFINFT